jgi:hypothetical protein
VGMVVAAGAGVGVNLRGPGAVVAAVVGERGQCDAEAFVAGPAEQDGPVFAGFLGHGCHPGQRGHGVGPVVGLPAVAPLGEHLGGVDLTRLWQRREDLGVWVLPEVGDDAAAHVLQRGAQGLEHGHQRRHRVADGLAQCLVEGAGRGGAQPGQQRLAATPAGVTVLGAERGQPFGAQLLGVGCGGVAGQELQGDRRLDVGEDGLGARPVRVQQCAQLVGGRHPRIDQIVAGAYHGTQRLRLGAVRHGQTQPVVAAAQVVRDDVRVAGVGLGTRAGLRLPPRLDGVGADRHHRMPGLQHRVHEASVRTLDAHRHAVGLAQPGQTPRQAGQPRGGVFHGECGDSPPLRVQDTHRVRSGGPVDSDEEQRFAHVERQHFSLPWQRRDSTSGADCRVVSNRRSTALLPVAGRQPRENRGRRCHAGPPRAPATGRHPGSRRVPTETLSRGPVGRMVP